MLVALLQAVRFYSRLRVPVLASETDPYGVPDFSRLPLVLPFAGILLALPGSVVLALSLETGLPSLIGAILAIGVTCLITGAFHEDGLADMADGFGGGATIERRLEIMKDSRIGSFGAAALIFVVLLRITTLAAIADKVGTLASLSAFVGAALISRCCGLVPLAFLKPARSGGFSASISSPGKMGTGLAIGLGTLVMAGLHQLAGSPISATFSSLVGAVLPAFALTRLSAWLIDGQTGDVAGAVQQLSEAFCLIGFLMILVRM
jgi:adenosylcobinamide-GDP ribazoletransferase